MLTQLKIKKQTTFNIVIIKGSLQVGVRSTGTGIAAMLGKVGAVLGVFFMPMLLKWGGIEVLLWVSIGLCCWWPWGMWS